MELQELECRIEKPRGVGVFSPLGAAVGQQQQRERMHVRLRRRGMVGEDTLGVGQGDGLVAFVARQNGGHNRAASATLSLGE